MLYLHQHFQYLRLGHINLLFDMLICIMSFDIDLSKIFMSSYFWNPCITIRLLIFCSRFYIFFSNWLDFPFLVTPLQSSKFLFSLSKYSRDCQTSSGVYANYVILQNSKYVYFNLSPTPTPAPLLPGTWRWHSIITTVTIHGE